MYTIYKYPLAFTDSQTIEMPRAAQILSVASQDGRLCLWAMVQPGATSSAPRNIRIIGTGIPIADATAEQMEFIGTVVIRMYVWHVFEYGKPYVRDGR